MRVAHQLEEGSELRGLLRIHADGRDLDPIAGLTATVAVDLRVEAQRPLRRLAHATLVGLVHRPGDLGAGVLGRRTPGNTFDRTIDLIAPPGTLRRIRLDVEPRRDDQP